MSIEELLNKIYLEVREGRIAFQLTRIPVMSGGAKLWIESFQPVSELSPLRMLAGRGVIPPGPPYGLSWEDYGMVVDAELDRSGAALRDRMLLATGLKRG